MIYRPLEGRGESLAGRAVRQVVGGTPETSGR